MELTVNGHVHQIPQPDPHQTLLEWLRSQGLLAAKEGCAEGECGACAVLVARPDGDGSRLESVNACLLTLAALHGMEVVTAEGLGTPQNLHPAQRQLAEAGGSQCGYCTPGFVSSLAGEYYRRDRRPGEHGAPSGVDLHALSGNLCRCTGYRPIRDAAHQLGFPAEDDRWVRRTAQPASLGQPVAVTGPYGEFHRPATLAEALDLLAEHEDARPLAGGTDWNVEVNLRHARPSYTIAVDALPELRALEVRDDEIELGAGLSLADLERGLAGRIPLLDQLWPQFASPLIRHSATLGGNLGTASPIGDSPPALLALDARLTLRSREGERQVALADYFTGYRQTVRRRDELIVSVTIPLPLAPTTGFHKVAKRRYDDISGVAVAFALDTSGGTVRRARIGLGGVAATPIRAYDTERLLEGRPWTADTVREAAAQLGREGTPIDDVRASSAYRKAMLEQSLLRFFAQTQGQIPQEAHA